MGSRSTSLASDDDRSSLRSAVAEVRIGDGTEPCLALLPRRPHMQLICIPTLRKPQLATATDLVPLH